ncbi:MAG: hypothetical protein COU69_02045 [Candidatus Pacebacteria bacterium CG10_big_fil_rev_8_21_14_0_10_56_10]|nr:MAG: hypothetical protein COU69_02045 [Candidatus Pacebacteria bacterium CG10_big_fil_rev_8_21_14_0_10_56_10]
MFLSIFIGRLQIVFNQPISLTPFSLFAQVVTSTKHIIQVHLWNKKLITLWSEKHLQLYKHCAKTTKQKFWDIFLLTSSRKFNTDSKFSPPWHTLFLVSII